MLLKYSKPSVVTLLIDGHMDLRTYPSFSRNVRLMQVMK